MIESIFNCHLLCSRVSEDVMNLMLLPGFPSYQADPGESFYLVGWKTWITALEDWLWTSLNIRCHIMYLISVFMP